MKHNCLRLLILFFTFSFTLPAFSEIEEYFEIDGISYGIISDTEVGVSGCDNEIYDLVIPGSVSYGGKDYVVSQIINHAFWSSQFRTAEIPSTVTSIGQYAFLECMYLTNISLPNAVTFLGEGAFQDCKSLESFDSGNSLPAIEESTFSGCVSLRDVNLGNSITSIGWAAFEGCASLQEIAFSDSVETLDSYVLKGCINLKTVYIGKAMTEVSSYAFYECDFENLSINCKVINNWFKEMSKLKYVEIGNYCEKINSSAFYRCSSLEKVKIGNSVEIIGERAFDSCEKLTDIEFGESIKVIEGQAFIGCYEISELNLPESLEYIGEWAFGFINNIKEIIIPASVTTIGSFAFSECKNLKKVWLDGSNLTIAGDYGLFSASPIEIITIEGEKVPDIICYDTDDLKEVNIGRNVTSIGRYAFANCTQLAYIDLPKTVSFIGEGAFMGCSSLSSITIPDAVSEISRISFIRCSSLADVTLGENLEYVESDAFAFCTGIKNVYSFSKIVPRLGDRCFDELPEGAATLYVREALLNDYKISHWTVYFSKVLPLDDAGIESIFINDDSNISVYTKDGILLKKNCKIEYLKSLPKDIYIIVSGKERYKISI